MMEDALVTIDGCGLDEWSIRRAWHGSVHDMAVVRLSVANMLESLNMQDLMRIATHNDVINKRWHTDVRNITREYADELVEDWRRYGSDTYVSLHDYVVYYAFYIKETASRTPEWNTDDTVRHGHIMVPRILDVPDLKLLPTT